MPLRSRWPARAALAALLLLSTSLGAGPPARAAAVTTGVLPVPAGVHKITFYCLYGHMANGLYVHYGSVAADPSIYDLGTRLFIEGMGHFVVRDRFAEDWRQKRLDVWVPSCDDAIKRGVQYRMVTVLD
jgi:3D (Asp-Asp-Asp) domain-containing protein